MRYNNDPMNEEAKAPAVQPDEESTAGAPSSDITPSTAPEDEGEGGEE